MLFAVIWLSISIAASVIMQKKGRSGIGGFVLGFCFGPIGLLLTLILSIDQNGLERQALTSGESRKCPACAEIIRTEASKCRYCGTNVPTLPKDESFLSMLFGNRD